MLSKRAGRLRALAIVFPMAIAAVSVQISGPNPAVAASGPAPVIVATFDTGTNPFHPCFRRDWGGMETPRSIIPGYPRDARALSLSLLDSYERSLDASKPALRSIQPETLYFIPGTNLSFFGISKDSQHHLVDDYPHGAQASSQIACGEFGLAPNAHLLIVNDYDDHAHFPDLLRWTADQKWIDVVHLNMQDWPLPVPGRMNEAIRYAISKGKFVVVAAGNGVAGASVNYPMELSRINGPPGSLVVGANDNGGWTVFSNLNPHVVMDGGATVAASPDSYDETSFSGTSSSSPRVTGYVARILGELRAEFGHTWEGLLTIPAGSTRPTRGPLTNGTLSAKELHEVVRKTADPNPHESRYDGGTGLSLIPQPVDLPFAFYPKMGYGEVSEHTIQLAIDVLAGRAPMPLRPNEDRHYQQSENLRKRLWGP